MGVAHLYKITNKETGQYYIGKRKGTKQGRYWGSGLRIKRQINKYGKENFTYDVLKIDNEDKIFKIERRLITENYIKNNSLCLNLAPGGIGGSGLMNKDYMRGDKNPSKRPEVRAKLKALLNENHPMIKLIKKRHPNKGKKQLEEFKRKTSKTLKNLFANGLKNGMTGKKHSKETREKMSKNHYNVNGKNNPFYGKSHTQRVINILREKNSKPYSFISPEGKIYKGRNLVEFCKNMKVSYDSMYLVRVGRQKNYKGWRNS